MGGGDAISVATSMIKKGYGNNCIALAKFPTSRVASDRGSGNAFVRYDEVNYYPYSQAPDLDWSIIKKTY